MTLHNLGSGKLQLAQRGHLKLSGLVKHFDKSKTLVLQDISLDCRPGEFVVVVGPSGCGKSTLLNIAAGMLKPDEGSVLLDDQIVTSPGPDRAVVFQEHGLFPWLNAADNVGFGLKMKGIARSEREDRVHEALKMVHLSHSAGKYIHELSGGMRQRVAIARALILDPAVLLMDEPFGALDEQTRNLMHEQLQEIWSISRKTILFVTHSVDEAVRLADRVIVFHAHPGRVRREFKIGIEHPRDFESDNVIELVKQVRREIEDEVNRVNQQMAQDFWRPAKPGSVVNPAGDLGSSI